MKKVNQKLRRCKVEWTHDFDSLHTWVISNIICSAMRWMISWWIKIYLSLFITFRTKNCYPFLPFLFTNTPSQMNIFTYSTYYFLLQPPAQPAHRLFNQSNLLLEKENSSLRMLILHALFSRCKIFTKKT